MNPTRTSLPQVAMLTLVLAAACCLCSPQWTISIAFAEDPQIDSVAKAESSSQIDSATAEEAQEQSESRKNEVDDAADSREQVEAQSDSEDAISSASADATAEIDDDEVWGDAGAANSVDEGSDASQTSKDSESSTVELSVEPGSQPLLPVDRPAWIGADPDYSGDVHRLYVGSTAAADEEELDDALDVALMAAVNQYLDDQVLNRLGASTDLQLDDAFIRRNLIPNPEGVTLTLNTAGEPLYQKWVVVEITPTQREQFRQWYREALQRDRIKPLVAGLAGLLGIVGLSHLVLRRRHGLPSSQPFSSAQLEAKPDSAGASKKGFGLWAPLVFVFSTLFLLFVVAAPLLVLGKMKVKSGYEVQQLESANGNSVIVVRSSKQSEATGQMSESQQELIFESNGQEIIQRVQRVR